jgi:hypothetical protein
MCTRGSSARINKWARKRNAAARFLNRLLAAPAALQSVCKALNRNWI